MIHLNIGILGRFVRLLTAVQLLSAIVASAATTNFSTGFESTQGYVIGPLANQLGWVGYVLATNNTSNTNGGKPGNGVITPGLGGSAQAAYVGLSPLIAPHDKQINLVRFLNIDPIISNQPIVSFTTKLKLEDSTNFLYDYFYFEFYNKDDLLLFGIEFNNNDLAIFRVDSTNAYFPTPGLFANSVEYSLAITMNFASNRYNATFNGLLIVTNQPMTISGLALNLGSVDAVWSPGFVETPGNNRLIFDDWEIVSAPPPARPQLRMLTPGGAGAATIRLTGSDFYKFAVDSSTNLLTWQPVATNTVSGGIADYMDSSATGKSSRFYRARWVP